MEDDFPFEDAKIMTESQYQRDGTIIRFQVYRFFLGKHGPFTERVSLEPFDPTEIQRRVDTLRAHLRDGIR